MIIEKLSVKDFRVFQGKHDFDLRPRIKYNKVRPIILYGGLNGTGKTTTLTAVRLALYGRQSLGHGTSQKAYEQFLQNCIHRNKKSPLPANAAKVELHFTYATLGVERQYTVIREWMIKGKKVIEKIRILENEKPLSELNNEQCQAFLDELIPIGVSDLFFFDGEKIAELAEDTGGAALGDAIKKLLGLDIIDTLSADLNLLTRNQLKKDSSITIRAKMDSLEKELGTFEKEAEVLLIDYLGVNAKVTELQANADKIEHELSAKGGAWASSREDEIKTHAALTAEKSEIENQLRDIFSASYPITLAEGFCRKSQRILTEEKEAKKRKGLADMIQSEIFDLRKSLKKTLTAKDAKTVNSVIDKQFSKFNSDEKIKILHDISDSSFTKINNTIDDALTIKKPELDKLSKRLEEILSAIDKSGKNIARAPEEANIKPYLIKLNELRETLTANIIKKTKLHEAYRRKLREAMDVTRQLDKLSQEIKGSENTERSYSLAIAAKEMLREFSIEMAARKVKDLEREFINSFDKLSRKEDVHLNAKISTKDFSVTLIDEFGHEVNKDDLSAGEKQIYAIAILEALAKTSGRHLPIIIDTPLGRLDSIHREKLVNHYFPNASHQVIILSTDTEVDEAFYSDLSTSISHAYKLDYNSDTASTFAEEGYFWRKSVEEAL